MQHSCHALLAESGVEWRGTQPRRRVRTLDGTVIKEPGPTGAHWRVHYSRRLPEAGSRGPWAVWMQAGEERVGGRLCAVRKSQQASAAAERKIAKHAQKHGIRVRPETREYAHYVLVFTTSPEAEMGTAEVLEYYRFRWQIELVFKRLKSLLAVGHLPKHDARSSRAWLYGKLCVALLTQKLAPLGAAISPWGYELETRPRRSSVAGVPVRPAPTAASHCSRTGAEIRNAALE